MICRLAIHDKPPGSIEDPRAEEFRQWIKSQPGFVAGWHGQDPETGRSVSFTVWETEEHVNALKTKQPPGGPVGMKPVQMDLFRNARAF